MLCSDFFTLFVPHILLKGFTSESVFTGLGENSYICETSSMKPFVAREEAACNLTKYLQYFLSLVKLNHG